LPLKLSV